MLATCVPRWWWRASFAPGCTSTRLRTMVRSGAPWTRLVCASALRTAVGAAFVWPKAPGRTAPRAKAIVRARTTASCAREGRRIPTGSLGKRLGLVPGQQPAALRIDQLEADRAQAVADAEDRDVVEDLVLVVGPLEVVVGDLGAEVVDVVEADVAGEELEQLRQLQIGAALQGSVVVAPVLRVLPVDVLELVLDIEHPDAHGPGDDRGRHLHQQPGDRTDEPEDRTDHEEQGEVGEPDAVPHPRPLVLRPDPRPDPQRPDRADPEHHRGVAEEPIAEPLLPAACGVLGDGHSRHVAGAAAVEIAGGAVMDGVVVAPVGEGLKEEEGGEAPEPEVAAMGGEERAVGTVVEDDEGPQEEAGGGNGECEGQPDGDVEADVHRRRQQQVRQHRGGQIEQAARPRGALVKGDRAAPLLRRRLRVWMGQDGGVWFEGDRHEREMYPRLPKRHLNPWRARGLGRR